MLGDKGNFALGWCRIFNQVAFTIGALVKVIITQPRRSHPLPQNPTKTHYPRHRNTGHTLRRNTPTDRRVTPSPALNHRFPLRRQQPILLSALARPENQNPAPNLSQTLFG